MSQTTISVRLDSNDKKRFEEFCSAVGMNVSTAVNMFVKVVLRESRLPFEVESYIPNEETIAAIEEGERMLRDPNTRVFHSIDELLEDLEN